VWLTAYVPLVVWIFLVLSLGSGVGASTETSRIIGPILHFIFPSASPETLAVYHGYIRKLAHFVEYAVLALLAVRAFAPINFRFVVAFFLVLTVAAVDEINQSFNPSRTSSPWDGALDALGGLTALTAFWIAVARRSRS